MSLFDFHPRQARILWLEPHRICMNGQSKPLSGLPTEDHLAQALTGMPAGPTKWIVDDLWAPAVILRDIAETPAPGDARDQFFRWKYAQALTMESPQSVQALALEGGAWLLAGLPQALRDSWVALGARLNRPIYALVPRWLWLYNRIAPTVDKPGLLLSLAPHPSGGYTGTLAAWGKELTLLRQWQDPADQDAWLDMRVLPTVAYLTRENRRPHELWVWGAPSWPNGELATRTLQPTLPTQEAL